MCALEAGKAGPGRSNDIILFHRLAGPCLQLRTAVLPEGVAVDTLEVPAGFSDNGVGG